MNITLCPEICIFKTNLSYQDGCKALTKANNHKAGEIYTFYLTSKYSEKGKYTLAGEATANKKEFLNDPDSFVIKI